MKLNIHQIFEQISADIFVIKEQNQNSCTITRVRKFLPETTVIDSDTLYLIDSSYSFPPDFSFPAHMLFINQYPEISLKLVTADYPQCFDAIQRQHADLAFTGADYYYKNIISIPGRWGPASRRQNTPARCRWQRQRCCRPCAPWQR
mgnify:CR=1 FL=1